MKATLQIKNFRVFDQTGCSISLSPITFLTGCNSSGKSSAVKGIFLLDSFMSQIKKAVENGDSINLSKYKLDFSTYPNNTLGRFSKVLNRSCDEKELITFEYTTYSLYLGKNVNVVLNFTKSENDELDNGYLHSMEIYVDDELFYKTGKGTSSCCNLNFIKEQFAYFTIAEWVAHNYMGACGEYDLTNNISREEFEQCKKTTEDFLCKNGKRRCSDIYYHIRYSKLDPIVKSSDLAERYIKAIEYSSDNDMIFVVPVVENYLSAVSVGDFKDKCNALLDGSSDESDLVLLNKVLDDFTNSNASDFGEYFKMKEDEYLSEVQMNGIFSPISGLVVPKMSHFSLKQDFGARNPLNIICSIDKGGKVVQCDNPSQKEEQYNVWVQTPLSFSMLYEFVMSLNERYMKGKDIEEFYQKEDECFGYSYVHFAYRALTRFACNFISDCLLPSWVGSLSYVGSSRVDVKRMYSLEDRNSFSALLKRYFEGKKKYLDNNFHKVNKLYVPDSFMNSWIRKFGIGEKISLEFDKEGLGVQIRLFKQSGKECQLLADEGYGITQLISVLLEIETAILNATPVKENGYYGLHNLPQFKHEALSQAITIALEEPEIHLHPKYQSMIAEMLMDAYKRFNIHFIIETHSEYLLRRTQFMVAQEKYENQDMLLKECPFKVFYFPEEGSAYDMQYRVNGKFTQSFGEGFFDEADKWVMKMYELEED